MVAAHPADASCRRIGTWTCAFSQWNLDNAFPYVRDPKADLDALFAPEMRARLIGAWDFLRSL